MCKIAALLICLVMSAFSGCGERSTSTQPANTQDTSPVIVRLETRDEMVTAMVGADGPVYTVRTKEGRILGQRLSEQELQVRLPHIYRLLRESYVEGNAVGVVWAGLIVRDPVR